MREFKTSGFNIEILRGLPGMSPLEVHQFARSGQSTHSEGTVLAVSGPKSWIGNFQSGHYYNGLTHVFPFQTGPSVCVFAGGQGYRLRLDTPKMYAVLQSFPVLGAQYINEQDWVVVWDFTRIEAQSIDGIVWRTRRLSWDGLSITEVDAGYMKGLAWDAANESEVEFRVELSTGEHTGGAKDVPDF
ncbi:MAG TPA: hypothetical protein VIX37_08325 [Candidatus Sulfotelmatobacter sp.]